MKNKASSVVKHIISFLTSISSKAKTIGIKTKADAMRARLVLISLLKTETRPSLTTSISHKFHSLLDRKPHNENDTESKAIVLHNASSSSSHNNASFTYGDVDDDDDDGKLPDLSHSYFGDIGEDEDDDQDHPQEADGSVIDQVKNSKEHEGKDFVLENEIDQVADLFIKRFQKQIRLQKMESFKRLQQMLDRSV